MDGVSRGYGYVYYYDSASAEKAKENLVRLLFIIKLLYY